MINNYAILIRIFFLETK